MRGQKTVRMLLALWLGLVARLHAAPLDSLRVYDIQPSVFDFVLTGLSRGGDGTPQLSFNDRTGNTYFKRVGDLLDTYRVTSYTVGTNRVFNASVKDWKEQRFVTVVLTTPTGAALTLVQDERLPSPGWTARLVALDTGAGWALRGGDGFICGAVTARVTDVSATAVTARVVGADAAGDTAIPAITGDERSALAKLWAENAKRRQARQAAIAQARREEEKANEPPFPPAAVPAPRPRQTIEVAGRSAASFGTYYRYPTEFQVIPAQWDTSGRMISETAVVPRRFETRFSGFSISTGH